MQQNWHPMRGAPVMKIVVTTIWKISHRVKTDSGIDANCFDKWWREPEWGHLWSSKQGVRIIPIQLIQMRTSVFTHFLTRSLLCKQTWNGLWKIRSFIGTMTISIVSFLENLILYIKHLVMLLLHQIMFIMVKAYSKIWMKTRVHQEYIKITNTLNTKNGAKKFCSGKSAVQGDTITNIAYRRRTNLHRNTDYQIRIYYQEEPWPFWRGGSVEVVNFFLLPARWTLVFNVEYETNFFSMKFEGMLNWDNFVSIMSENELSIVVVIV